MFISAEKTWLTNNRFTAEKLNVKYYHSAPKQDKYNRSMTKGMTPTF